MVQEAHRFQELNCLFAFTVPNVLSTEEAPEYVEGKLLGLFDEDGCPASVGALLVLLGIEVDGNLDLVGEVAEGPNQSSVIGVHLLAECETYQANLLLSYSQPFPILL